MQVVLQDCEHEAKVARDGGLAREQELNPLLHLEVLRIDVVVEGDHFVGELDVLGAHGFDGAAQRREDQLAFDAE